MDKPTEPGWYLFRYRPLGEADNHVGYWDGEKLLPYPEYCGPSVLRVEQFATFRPLIPEPTPEVIIDDRVTVLRPAQWEQDNNGLLWNSVLGMYRVFETTGGWWWMIGDGEDVVRDGLCPTIEAAKSACWKDYVARILTALAIAEVPQPEVIIGNGVTVLRPGVWVARNVGGTRWWNSHLVESDCAPFVTWNSKEYTRIGDVPGERE